MQDDIVSVRVTINGDVAELVDADNGPSKIVSDRKLSKEQAERYLGVLDGYEQGYRAGSNPAVPIL